VKVLNQENFHQEINKDKLVVVDFYADWCMPCRLLQPVLEKLEKEFSNVEFAKLNTDENPQIAMDFAIFSIPTVLIFYKGEVVGSFIGAMPESVVRKEIEKALEKIVAVQ
jgi:thioredoxin 1